MNKRQARVGGLIIGLGVITLPFDHGAGIAIAAFGAAILMVSADWDRPPEDNPPDISTRKE